jgi:hypothetical protein
VGVSLRKQDLNLSTGGEKWQSKKQPPIAWQLNPQVSVPLGACTFRFKSSLTPQADLSAYRLQLQGVWHVAIVADTPTKELVGELEKVISGGELVELPSDALDFLRQRRAEQIQLVPGWNVISGLADAFRLGRSRPWQSNCFRWAVS